MASIKKVILIQEYSFNQHIAMTKKQNMSPSHISVQIVEENIQRYHNKKLFEELYAAYDDLPNEAKQEHRLKMRYKHRKLVEGQW